MLGKGLFSGLRGLAFYGLLESVVSALKIPVDMIDVSQLDAGSEVDLEIKESGVHFFGALERFDFAENEATY